MSISLASLRAWKPSPHGGRRRSREGSQLVVQQQGITTALSKLYLEPVLASTSALVCLHLCNAVLQLGSIISRTGNQRG